MFLPVGHDQTTVRRLPWVTFSLMGLCLSVFLLTLGPIQSTSERSGRLLTEIAKYYFTHPNLELEPELEDYLFGAIPESQGQREAFKEVLKEGARASGFQVDETREEPEESEGRQQAKLDRLTADFHRTVKSSPYFTFGLVPADQHIYAYITYQFMHGGWLHLIGNLFFLYLAGPKLEDVWGRPLFAAFYLSAGVFAALIYVMRYPMMEGPLVGASGAIAGLMGAFLIRYGTTKIKMLVWVFIMRPKFLDVPAWLILPVWLLREVFSGQAVDFGGGQGSGVAHWAHVAGFLFGMVVAAGIKQFKFEERVVDTALDARAVQHENLDLEAALEARSRGQLEASEAQLLALLKKDPGDFDVAMAYWDVRRDIGDVAPAFPFVQRALWNALRRGDHEVVDSRWSEVMEMAPGGAIDPAMAARVLETLGDSLPEHVLRDTVEAGAAGVTSATPGGVLARLARVGVALGAPSARTLAEKTLVAPEVLDETRTEIEELLAGSPAPVSPEVAAAAAVDEVDEKPRALAPEDHELEIMEAVPTDWDFGILTISVGGKDRPMNLSQVQAIAVGGIVVPDQAPMVIIDLMIDGPWSKRAKLRTVRLRSTAFDPCAFADGPDPMSCFKRLLVEMIDMSGAAPLPDPSAAVGNPFKRFSSVQEYEQEVIGVHSGNAF